MVCSHARDVQCRICWWCLFFVAALSFPCEMSKLLKTILPHGKPWMLDTTEMCRFWAELICLLTSARKCFPFLISKVYSSLWPWDITTLLGCNRNRSSPSPRGVLLLNVLIADTSTFSRAKGHWSWRAVQMPTAAQCSVSTQLDQAPAFSLSITWWK